MKNKWYVATLIMRCWVGESAPGSWTCDRQICVIRATDGDEAYRKALRLGEEEEDSYSNAFGEIVHWEFVGLEDLDELVGRTIRDGTEIRSFLFEHDDPFRLIPQREELTIFWIQRNKHRTAQEIIDNRYKSDGKVE